MHKPARLRHRAKPGAPSQPRELCFIYQPVPTRRPGSKPAFACVCSLETLPAPTHTGTAGSAVNRTPVVSQKSAYGTFALRSVRRSLDSLQTMMNKATHSPGRAHWGCTAVTEHGCLHTHLMILLSSYIAF
ncbi:unnamed protein product [Lepidochelys kempii]